MVARIAARAETRPATDVPTIASMGDVPIVRSGPVKAAPARIATHPRTDPAPSGGALTTVKVVREITASTTGQGTVPALRAVPTATDPADRVLEATARGTIGPEMIDLEMIVPEETAPERIALEAIGRAATVSVAIVLLALTRMTAIEAAKAVPIVRTTGGLAKEDKIVRLSIERRETPVRRADRKTDSPVSVEGESAVVTERIPDHGMTVARAVSRLAEATSVLPDVTSIASAATDRNAAANGSRIAVGTAREVASEAPGRTIVGSRNERGRPASRGRSRLKIRKESAST